MQRPGEPAPDWTLTDEGEVESDAGKIVFDEGAPTDAQAEHIACHDPARALREVEADRKLLAALEEAQPADPHNEQVDATSWRLALELAVRIRASVYGTHPGYRPEWKP
jgi:Family of unknown function (DUF6221)